MDDDLQGFTVAEAARRLSLSEVELRRAIKRGDIKVKRAGATGHRIVVPAASIRAYLTPTRATKARKR